MSSQLSLFKTKRFFPFFLTQFLGAFNDNVFKNALVILITYTIAQSSQIMVTIAGGLFILPFFLFSSLAGQLADKFDKAQIIKKLKAWEIFLMILASLGFYFNSINFLLVILFLMGTQSAFFGPIKYGILTDHLKNSELIAGNAIINSATFLAILIGTIFGGILILEQNGILIISIAITIFAILGFSSSLFIPSTKPTKNLQINYNIFTESLNLISQAKKRKPIFLSILGIAWFWFIGTTFLTQFPNFAKIVIGGNEEIVTLLLTTFSIGIAFGSLICNRLLNGRVEATFVPLAAVGISIFTIDLFFAAPNFINNSNNLIGLFEFLSTPNSYRILFDLIAAATCGGIYIVPLYAIVQKESKPSHRARTIAALNIIDSMFMVMAAIFAIILFKCSFEILDIFLAIALINFAVALYICKLLPSAFTRSLFQWFYKFFYRVEVRGMENYDKVRNKKLVIIANHLSFLDPPMLACFMPKEVTFAINTEIAKKWWAKPFLKMIETVSIDPTNPMATKTLINLVKNKKQLVIFPEGRITLTGGLMKVYEGPGIVAEKADAHILPIRIEGAQYSRLSKLKDKARLKWFPKITVTVLPATKFNVPKELNSREKRQMISDNLQNLMANLVFESSNYKIPLFKSLLDTAKVHGFEHIAAEDSDFKPITYQKLITSSFILGNEICKTTKANEFVGILLPNMIGNLVTFFGMQAYSRVPAMLNFTAGAQNILNACKASQLKTIYTSRKFIETANLNEIIAVLEKEKLKVVYLEDVKKRISLHNKIKFSLIGSLYPEHYYKSKNRKSLNPNKPCVVLFTSGSEGAPKGVVLSHLNIQANRCQLSSKVDLNRRDIVFNALPIFHSFGLTAGTLLPLLNGVKVFLYPSPLHYKLVPELVYTTNSTILFGTNSFLTGYAKYAHPYDFYAIRYVFAGAEKLQEENRRIWSDKFGVRIFEGYGATETSPIISVNTPIDNKPGTVGKLLPGIKYEIKKVNGISQGGELIVSGPNIMLGYLKIDKPGKLQPPQNKKYNTGDIIEIDKQNFITIKGRSKRFAKIAGEMISLSMVETYLTKLWPNNLHAVLSKPDEKKGERLILLTDKKDANIKDIISFTKENGITELSIPKEIIYKDPIPLLGTGKINYIQCKELLG